jgi:hypothetical protein
MRLAAALGLAFSLVLAAGMGASARAQQALCGPADDQYVCGQIIVGLNPDVQAIIEDVVARHGGDPATDILEELEGLDAYVIAVPEGEEQAYAASYADDPDVEYAELNRVAETQVPDTAAAGLATPLLMPALVLLLAGLVGLTGLWLTGPRSASARR